VAALERHFALEDRGAKATDRTSRAATINRTDSPVFRA
jgi:hypothetical protein